MLTVAAISFAAPGFADDQVLATVNGQSITKADLLALMASLGPQLQQVPEAARPRAALDRLIDRVRRKLGETPASIDRFAVPLVPEKTASLDALKALTEASWLYNHGKIADAIPLTEHAIQLDPDFASAYEQLGALYITLGDNAHGAAALSKAYAMRDKLNERHRYGVATLYAEYVTKDFLEAIRSLQALTHLYPRDAVSWSNLADAENEIGQHGRAVEDGKQALALNPSFQNPYVVVTRAALEAGQTDEAVKVADQGLKKGFGGINLHSELLRLALERGDQAAVDRELAFANATPSTRGMIVLGELAFRRGQAKAAKAIFDRLALLGAQQGSGDVWRPIYLDRLAALGEVQAARAQFSPALLQSDLQSYFMAFAEFGDPTAAEAAFLRYAKAHPADILANQDFIPVARAILALRRGAPQQAIQALQPALAYRAAGYEVLSTLGAAYLALGDGQRAAATYQEILDHPGWAPESLRYPLARLGLARARKLIGDIPGSRSAYAAFAEAMKGGDADLPVVKAARMEARLEGG